MAGLSAREAGERVGLTKQAVLKAIKNGRISAEKDANGEWRIDLAELFRVYPAIAKVDDNQPPTGDAPGLRRENELLRDQVEDLRRRLDQSEEERRQAQERLMALLTDQRPAAQPAERRGFWRRLVRK